MTLIAGIIIGLLIIPTIFIILSNRQEKEESQELERLEQKRRKIIQSEKVKLKVQQEEKELEIKSLKPENEVNNEERSESGMGISHNDIQKKTQRAINNSLDEKMREGRQASLICSTSMEKRKYHIPKSPEEIKLKKEFDKVSEDVKKINNGISQFGHTWEGANKITELLPRLEVLKKEMDHLEKERVEAFNEKWCKLPPSTH